MHSSEEQPGNRSRVALEMEIIAMLRRLEVAPITMTRNENAQFGTKYQWQFMNLRGSGFHFIEALEDALNQAMILLWIMENEEVPPEIPESIRANLSEWNIKMLEARRERKLRERQHRDLE
jgi:hypothetical protein